jgi:hypothetical protein
MTWFLIITLYLPTSPAIETLHAIYLTQQECLVAAEKLNKARPEMGSACVPMSEVL